MSSTTTVRIDRSSDDSSLTVSISQLGGEKATTDFVEGKSVASHLEDAGISVGRDQTVTLNGEPVSDIDATVVPSNSILVVAPNVANG